MKNIKNKLLVVSCMVTAWITTFVTHASVNIDTGEQTSLGERVKVSDFAETIKNMKGIAMSLSGICTITALIFFIISLTKLSASAGNDQARSKALKGVMVSGISLALFGGATTIVGVFWGLIG